MFNDHFLLFVYQLNFKNEKNFKSMFSEITKKVSYVLKESRMNDITMTCLMIIKIII